jgi:hypothetical protein
MHYRQISAPRASRREDPGSQDLPDIAETRFAERLAHFQKLVEGLRQAAFSAGELESSSVSRAERAMHAAIVSYADQCLVWLLNRFELGRLLRQAALGKEARP